MKKQIEELTRDICGICFQHKYCDPIVPCENAKREAEALYNAGYRKQSEWISVEDVLPHELKKPILVTDGEKVIVAYRNWFYRSNSTGELRCPANYGNGMKVTHWMPLPEPPEMKGGAE